MNLVVRFIFAVIMIALAFRIGNIALEDAEKAKYNACRDSGSTIFYCVTGIKP